ncbi:MAG: LysM peptidoglycan-binding domain-containing protein [Desulfobacteraceae bacterium]
MGNEKLSEKENRKVSSHASGEGRGRSMLKKSELSLVLLGAGLLTLIVFFIFFSSPEDEKKPSPVKDQGAQALEKRLDRLEAILDNQGLDAENLSDTKEVSRLLESYNARVERVEAALSVKFETLAQRLTAMENKMSSLSKQVSAVDRKTDKVEKITLKKPAVDKKSKPVKTAVKSGQGKSVLYTVKKGDTLYSIGRMHDLSVDELRKLNKLTEKSKIYPGDNLLVE